MVAFVQKRTQKISILSILTLNYHYHHFLKENAPPNTLVIEVTLVYNKLIVCAMLLLHFIHIDKI